MALSLDQVTLDLGPQRVLDGVSLSIAPGRVTVILGPNGAGKTSLLRAMAGLVRPSTGNVAIDGEDIAAMATRDRARTIGYLPQQSEVVWNMGARDVVALGRLPHRSGVVADEAAIANALAATDSAALADRRIGELSGGERARILLARVLAGEPRWLLADEPLASLDPAHQLDLLDRLRAVARGGAGVAVVLHNLAQAARVADDAVLMAGGRVVAAGPAPDILTPDRLGELFGVRLVAVPGHPICIPVDRR
ncbi:ABC transporter ATP-binding protein [Sphingomonas sp.]|jgi:iron complex transport system ATP-binding protein|uniref:ABC transporter ATP-binding protein n=1 Tax=Sphingomonas sp. TaxID=28214 RepID=UPI002E371024|nr:ABC transporter ATP-binding protein [Sphingomonas sp.]HEX4694684.1 ABC transporter ATP-binding protein [Sphingomonas sp.]